MLQRSVTSLDFPSLPWSSCHSWMLESIFAKRYFRVYLTQVSWCWHAFAGWDRCLLACRLAHPTTTCWPPVLNLSWHWKWNILPRNSSHAAATTFLVVLLLKNLFLCTVPTLHWQRLTTLVCWFQEHHYFAVDCGSRCCISTTSSEDCRSLH